MKVTVLGYYGGYPYHDHGTSSYLITAGDGFRLLLDCGSGALISLEKVLDPFKLDAVIVSHYHHDHIADLGVLQYYYQLKHGTKKTNPLKIYGHLEDINSFKNLTFGSFTEGVGFDPNQKLILGPVEITFCRTIHPVTAYAMRIKETATGKVLTYTSDTRYFPELADFAKDSDVLIADTNFSADTVGDLWHMTSVQSAKLALEANAKTLLLSHLPQEVPLDQILQEAQLAAPKIEVVLASKVSEIQF